MQSFLNFDIVPHLDSDDVYFIYYQGRIIWVSFDLVRQYLHWTFEHSPDEIAEIYKLVNSKFCLVTHLD